MNSSSFYANLPLLTEFSDVGRQERYAPLPDDWHVVMCDVRNSTSAVETGHYKNVNTLGAAVITAILNAAGGTEIPFIFEGDGAMLCVPPELLNSARAALLQTQALARKSFGLDLRIASEDDAAKADGLYRELIARVREIYGADDACHPVWPPNLAFSFNGRQLGNEVGVRAMERGAWGKWLYLMKTRGVVLLGWFLITFGIRTTATDWRKYKTTLARNSDVKKFNDCFRQVLAGNAAQREALTAWLDQRFAQRQLVYGVHVANRAQMTCLVFDHAGRHLHFIDGADGGLSMAAKALKERVAKLD